MHRLRLAATLLLAFSTGAPAAAAGGNLIVDGGFEQYRSVPSWISLSAGSGNLPGWRVTSGAIDLVGGYFRAFEGKNSLEVGTPGAGAVEQTIPTVRGARYRLSFEFAGNPEGPPRVKRLAVTAGPMTRTFAFDITGRTRAAMGWRGESLNFVATATATVLRFARLDGGATAWWGPLIDNIRVVQSSNGRVALPTGAPAPRSVPTPIVTPAATHRAVAAPEPSRSNALGEDQFSGVWTGAYPGQPLRVLLKRYGSDVIAYALDGSTAIPAGHIAWEGRVDRTPIVVRGACVDPGAKGSHRAVIEWTSQDAFTLRIAACHASAILYTRTQ